MQNVARARACARLRVRTRARAREVKIVWQYSVWREHGYARALARARGLAHVLSVARRLFSIWRERKYLVPWAGLNH